MSVQETKTKLEDRQVNVKAKLALLWVALMFLYIYNDIFSIYQPGHVADLLDGHLEGVHFTQEMLIGAVLLMAVPSIMVLLSVTLKASIVRWLNILVGAFQLLVLLGTQFVGEGETWIYWRIYEVLEAAFLAFIVWTAGNAHQVDLLRDPAGI